MKNFSNSLKICIFAVMILTTFQAKAGSRYLRLTPLGAVSTYDIWIEEISWMVGTTAYPTTYATGETPAITSTQNPANAWRAYDGVSSAGSMWAPGAHPYPFSITCDLGEGVSVDPTEIRIAVEWNARTMSAFLCEGSTDNITWTTLCIKSGLVESNWVRDATNSFLFNNGSGDIQAPTVPLDLSSSAITQTSFNIGWTGSTDDTGVTGYLVYQGSALLGFTTTNSYSMSLLDAATTYNMTVKAVDAAGNISNGSTLLSVTTSVGNIPAGSITLITSNFTGSSPSTNLPWTKTLALDPHFTYSGWSLGAGTYPASSQVDNALAVRVSAGGTASTLPEAINDNEYVKFNITPRTGTSLNLNSAAVTFKVKLIKPGESPSKYSVLTSVNGFTEGNEIYTSSSADVNPWSTSEQPITFNFPATGYDNITGPIEVRVYMYATQYDDKATSITSWTMSGKVSDNIPAGQVMILSSDFTGIAPSSNLPWVKTSTLDSHLTFSGWNRGEGTYSAIPQIDNAFALWINATGTFSSLQEAINDNEYVTFTITPNAGSKLDLNSSLVAFKIKLDQIEQSPSKFSVFTGINGFTDGSEVYTSTSSDVNNWNVATEQVIGFYFPATGYDNITIPLEVRVYLHAAQYGVKTTSITSWVMSGAMTTDTATGMSNNKADSNSMITYPNPALDMLSLNFGSQVSNGILVICDSQGRNVIKKSFTTQIENIDVSNLSSGIYFVKVSMGNKVINSKFVKK